jgi:hypothetical protein
MQTFTYKGHKVFVKAHSTSAYYVFVEINEKLVVNTTLLKTKRPILADEIDNYVAAQLGKVAQDA